MFIDIFALGGFVIPCSRYQCFPTVFQSDKEKRQGLPVLKHMDRDHVTKPGAQIGFITYILLPMFEVLAKVTAQFMWSETESKIRLRNITLQVITCKFSNLIVETFRKLRTNCHSQW